MRDDGGVKRALLRAFSLLFSVLPPAICTLLYFPVFRARGGEAMLSGFAALLLILSAVPLFRAMKRYFTSPAAWMIWLFAFLLFRTLSAIAAEAEVIAFTGFLGNLIGAVLWKIADRTGTQAGQREQR